ncbi:deaminase domain-containing protein [Paenibacillus sp. NPDC058174]|uniref:deaminase domain-containing protein n=1 Tax=Paenibacillus sp. NPDC058174 TaxID=3346366 RepID=UPI0036DC649E
MGTIYQRDGFELQWPYAIKDVHSFRIERAFNAHTRCVFTVRMREEEAEQCLLQSSFNDSVSLQKRTDSRTERWFAGGITKVDIHMEDGIPLVEVHMLSRTYSMDMQPKSRSYQNKYLTYTDTIQQLAKEYPGGEAQNMATSDQAYIGSLLVQYEETDWQFLKRLASRVGTVILPDVTMDAPRVYFGVPDFSWGKDLHARRYTMMKDRKLYEELLANADSEDAQKLVEDDFISYRVTSEQYFEVGDNVSFKNQIWVVSESIISYVSGLLQYQYLLVKRQSLRRKSRRNDQLQGRSLEGRVVKRANNMVYVHLDVDDQHDEQGNWWFPYSGEGNNIFHCLPDEGSRIKVYFPSGSEKQAIAINSVRGGSEEMKSRTVFQKPTTKVFEMPGDARMQLGDDGVLFEKGTVSLHLDGQNIRVNASEDLLVVAGSSIEAGNGSGQSMLESFRIRANQQIVLQTNTDQYVMLNGNRVGIRSAKLDFQKVEVDFVELLTEDELEDLYTDMLAKEEIRKQELELSLKVKAATQYTKEQRADIRSKVIETAKSDPALRNQAREWMSQKPLEEQRAVYQQKYVKPPPEVPEKKGKEKQAELERQQQVYEQMDRDRSAIYEWKQRSKRVMEQGAASGKSDAEIQAMLPAPPVLGSSPDQSDSSGKSGLAEGLNMGRGFRRGLQQIKPWLEQMELEYIIPQKPDYLSKKTQKTVYLSRYTYEKLIIDPQILIAEFNLIFGVIALIATIPTGGGSLYLLAVADAALGVSMIIVNMQKLTDLKNGIADTNPKLLGMDQAFLDNIGIGLMVVNLSLLARHGLHKAADKLVNSRNMSALDETWSAWKKQVELDLPAAKIDPVMPPKTKPTPRKLGGPGKNLPIDEFDDTHIYSGASKGKTGAKGEDPPKRTDNGSLGISNRFPTRQIDPVADAHILEKVAGARGGLSNKYKESGNFAYAEVNVSGVNKTDFYAHSGIHNPAKKIPGTEEFSFKPENPTFKATEAPDNGGNTYLRDGDTEYKILNDLAEKIGDNTNASGSIKLFTEKDTCGSCNKIIQQFSQKYPNIKIEVIHNNEIPVQPKTLN